MPLPLILGIGAAIAGAAGVGAGIHGAVKMKDAKDTMKAAQSRHEKNQARMETQNKETTLDMDNLGEQELHIMKSFDVFTDVIGRIQNKPEFKSHNKDNVKIPSYDAAKLKDVSIGAGVLLGGIGGAAAGTAGGFAAAGATTAAVMALGTASTGTAIASLSGVAATNAALAALGGGAIAAGGGGIALGTTILGAATLGVGLLVGGLIFSVTGSSLSDKADEAWAQMEKAEKEINRICDYCKELSKVSVEHHKSLTRIGERFIDEMSRLMKIVYIHNKTDWNDFTSEEKTITENTATLVGILFKMCEVKIVMKSDEENGLNIINYDDIKAAQEYTNKNLEDMGMDDLKIS